MESSKDTLVLHCARGVFLASLAVFIFTSMITSAAVSGPLVDEHLSASVGNFKLAINKAPLDRSTDDCIAGFAGVELDSTRCGDGGDVGGGSGAGWKIPVGSQATLTVTPETIEPGQMVTISWETQGIKSCVVAEDGKEISKYTDYTNLRRGPLSAETIYTLSCLGEDKNTKIDKTVTVKVDTVIGAPTVTISADPAVVDYNGDSTISWQSVGADSCVIFKNGSEVARGNSYEAKNLIIDTVFKVKCSNRKGSVADTIEILVRPPRAPEVTFSAEPMAVAYNGTSKVRWAAEFATNCTVKKGIYTVGTGVQNEKDVSLLKTDTVFTLTCNGQAGTKTEKEITVTVARPEAPVVSISAESSSIAYEGRTKIVWSSTNADSCVVSSTGMQRTALQGSYDTPALTKNTTYSISCNGPGGRITGEAVVTVSAPERPAVTLSVSKKDISLAENITYSWQSRNARTCTVYKNNSQIRSGLSGSNIALPSMQASSVIWVTCTGAGGTVVSSEAIQVNPSVVSRGGDTAVVDKNTSTKIPVINSLSKNLHTN